MSCSVLLCIHTVSIKNENVMYTTRKYLMDKRINISKVNKKGVSKSNKSKSRKFHSDIGNLTTKKSQIILECNSI